VASERTTQSINLAAPFAFIRNFHFGFRVHPIVHPHESPPPNLLTTLNIACPPGPAEGPSLTVRVGDGLAYLRANCVLSQAEESFAASLYTLISDEAVHPLFSEREYARLFRNVSIEYALLFLSKLEKLGLKR
jgi:hypothetical protein